MGVDPPRQSETDFADSGSVDLAVPYEILHFPAYPFQGFRGVFQIFGLGLLSDHISAYVHKRKPQFVLSGSHAYEIGGFPVDSVSAGLPAETGAALAAILYYSGFYEFAYVFCHSRSGGFQPLCDGRYGHIAGIDECPDNFIPQVLHTAN